MKTRALMAAGMLLVATAVAGCSADTGTPPKDPQGTAKKPVKLTFMAYGAAEEVEALKGTVAQFNEDNPKVKVSFKAVDNEQSVVRALRSETPPDIYLLSRQDLGTVVSDKLNQPLDELLAARDVAFGDDYKRDALMAFSEEGRLQCMPYAVSPMVIYFNTNLIDWAAMREAELPTPRSHAFWTFGQFAAAAEFAAGRPGAKGVHIDPTLEGIAPFIYSGGGELFDDPKQPTSLTLSAETDREALAEVLDVLRNNQLTPTPKQLAKMDALERFKTGKLGMIAGYRNLVPELRKTPSLQFDVMPMPAIDNERTIGDVKGLCLSASASSTSAAADFVVHAMAPESVSEVAKAGYLVPASNEVAESDAFLQRDQLPAHAEVFNRSVRDIVTPPALEVWGDLEQLLAPHLHQLFYARVLEDLQAATEEVDELSRTVLAPVEESPSQSPSTGATTDPSSDPSDDSASSPTPSG
ncbi:ABC transporter substrate-binding protein [Nocardioides sp. Bht2]|uniref:ABC transporter substrate-binding protein n=1 Tax=Nocardioides sp. Bht2 TaxID=3392297 RepID=UPI0039B3C733